MAGSLVRFLLVAAWLAIGVYAGQIPSCQNQLITSLSAAVDISLFNSACVRSAFPGLSSITSSQLISNDNCNDNILQLRSIVDVILRGLTSNNPVCGINMNSLNLLNANIRLDLLGLASLGISVLDVKVLGLQNVNASVTILTQSPLTLRVDLDVPMNLRTQIQASVSVGLSILSLPISINVPVDIKARAAISLLVSIGGDRNVNVRLANPPFCSVDDYDFSNGGLLGVLNIGVVTSLVSTVVTGLVNSVGVLLANLWVQLLTTCVRIVLTASIA
ncbi:hypothetical protein CHUAL_009997 [Chamberlinius hualienensis]